MKMQFNPHQIWKQSADSNRAMAAEYRRILVGESEPRLKGFYLVRIAECERHAIEDDAKALNYAQRN